MIRSNELRIGNVVTGKKNEYLRGAFITTQQEVIVKSITEFGINYDIISNEVLYTFNDISHIPLTEEWLVKFGFSHEGEAISRLKLDTEFGEITINLKSLTANCQYVHQLQNLHFALTQKELEIK